MYKSKQLNIATGEQIQNNEDLSVGICQRGAMVRRGAREKIYIC